MFAKALPLALPTSPLALLTQDSQAQMVAPRLPVLLACTRLTLALQHAPAALSTPAHVVHSRSLMHQQRGPQPNKRAWQKEAISRLYAHPPTETQSLLLAVRPGLDSMTSLKKEHGRGLMDRRSPTLRGTLASQTIQEGTKTAPFRLEPFGLTMIAARPNYMFAKALPLALPLALLTQDSHRLALRLRHAIRVLHILELALQLAQQQ
jgi:hypothetical protein